VNLAGVRVLFELEERLGARILETLYTEPDAIGDNNGKAEGEPEQRTAAGKQGATPTDRTAKEI
jgi:hypothetical protein